MGKLGAALGVALAFVFVVASGLVAQVQNVGPGSTVQGDIARGQGIYLQGLAWYELNAANAARINAETMIKWNREMNRLYAEEERINALAEARKKAKARARMEELERLMAERETRLRTQPTPQDIRSGNALNALVRDLSDASVQESAWRLAQVPLPEGTNIRSLVFRFAVEKGQKSSEALRDALVAVGKLRVGDRWPVALRDPALDAEEKAYEKAVETVFEECKRKELKRTSIMVLWDAVESLRAKVPSVVPTKGNFRTQANEYVRGLYESSQLFKQSDLAEELVGDVELHDAQTVGELLAFMRKYRLLFAEADAKSTPLYDALYASLREQKQKLGLRGVANPRIVAEAVKDPFQPGTVWRGSKTTANGRQVVYSLRIVKRDGDRFWATSQTIIQKTHDHRVEGVINNREIKYRELGPTNHDIHVTAKFDNMNVFISNFQGTGNAGGRISGWGELKLQR